MRRLACLGLLLALSPAASAQTPVTGQDLENLPIIAYRGPVARDTMTALPLRSVREVAALAPAFRRDLATGTLVFRSRTGGLGGVQEPVFVVDGVRRLGGPLGASTLSLLGTPEGPFAAVRRVDALGGFVPATLGEAGGGLVRVTTDMGYRPGLRGRVEGFSSEATDAYGTNLASATVRGPLGRSARVGGFSVTGEVQTAGDAVPSAAASLRLVDAAAFGASPQAVLVREGETVRAVPFPADAALAALAAGRPFRVPELLAALGLPPTAELVNATPVPAASALTEADVERVRAQDDPLRTLSLSGQTLIYLPSRSSLRLGATLQSQTASATAPTPAEAFRRRLANQDGLSRQTADRASAFAALDRIALPGGVEAGLRASFETTRSTLHPAAFSADVEDALLYGDIDANAAAQRYFVFRAGEGYVPQYTSDGGPGPTTRPISGFAQPGAPSGRYERQTATSTQAAASLTRTVGAHRVEVGAEAEMQTFRRFTLDGSILAAFVADADGGQGVQGFPNGVTRYDQLDFETLRSFVQTYGYTFNGLNTADSEDVAAYFPDASGQRMSTDVAPFRPLTAAVYFRDVFRVGPAEIDAGLRLDHYDARATTLFDPYTTRPILRADDLASAPSGIGGDFAVYQSGGQTVGFRDRDGQFYDASGNQTTADVILSERRGSVVETAGPISEAFAQTRAVTRLQPRVGVRVQATTAVAVTGYAVRLSRRPDPALYVPFTAYEQAFGGTVVPGSASLRPEDILAAGLGVEVQASPALTLAATAFGRQTRDIAALRSFAGGFPQYAGVDSYGGRDEAGIDLTAHLARTRGVAVAAGYTFSIASDATGGSVAGLLVSADSAPSLGETRHALDLALDARVPAGLGLLSGTGVGVVVAAQSGLPYTALGTNTGFSVLDTFTPNIAGSVNSARLPWTTQVDVRVDRRFAAGPASITVFVWAENLLGTRNVLAVYRATGQPDRDGFPETASGQSVLATPGDRLLYEAYTGGPVNVGGRQSTGAPFVYGQPRQIRIGLVLGA
ncbi:MAG TPA: hypothetical protein VGB53_05525 [Rubricoccaceae bacterium]|jgi:hypothetical protein